MPAPEKQCDLCEGQSFERVGQFDRRGKPLETVLCRKCGLVSHGYIPSEQELEEFYASDYRREYHGELTPSSRRVMRAWCNGQAILQRLQPFLEPASSVFEVGAGIGCTVKAFERAGYLARGIEPNEGFHGYSRRKLRAEIADQFLFNLVPRAEHDAVLLVHVIEHFRSPRMALQHLHGLIRADGLLYLECPNLGAPFATRQRLFHYAHIHNFTPATLEMMARAVGFEVVQWFSDWHTPNVEVLLRRTEPQPLMIDPSSYRRTRDSLEQYTWLTYHARLSYWTRRIRQLAGYAWEHLVAERYVGGLLQEIEREEQMGGEILAAKS